MQTLGRDESEDAGFRSKDLKALGFGDMGRLFASGPLPSIPFTHLPQTSLSHGGELGTREFQFQAPSSGPGRESLAVGSPL